MMPYLARILLFVTMIGMVMTIAYACWAIMDGYTYMNRPQRGPVEFGPLWWQRKPFRIVFALFVIEFILAILTAMFMPWLQA